MKTKKNGNEGDYRIKTAHIYLEDRNKPEYYADSDTNYCGNVVLSDNTFVICGHGKFSPMKKIDDGKILKTYVASKKINLRYTDELIERCFEKKTGC